MEKKRKPFSGILPNLPDETMTPGRMRIKTDGCEEAKRHIIERDGSSVDFRSGMPIGNGDFGAMIHGYPDNYTFHIAKNDVWWDDFDSDPPCYVDYGIEGVRKKALAGDNDLKLDIFEASSRRNNQPLQTEAARLTLHLCSGAVFAKVHETLDIASGIATQKFKCGDSNGIIQGSDFTISSCVSHVNDVMQVYCAPSAQAGRFGNIRIELTRDPMEVSSNMGTLTAEKIAQLEDEIDKYYTPECFVDGEYFGFNMRLRSGSDPETAPDVHYTVLIKTNSKKLRLGVYGSSVFAEGRPEPGELRLRLTVVSTYDADDTVAEAKRRLEWCDRIFPGVVDHVTIEWFQHNWKRSWIRLPDTRDSLPWYFGLYEAFCARRPGKFAPGYIAPWFCGCYANWGYHILTYEQTKSNLGLLATNRAELLECWFALCKNSREKLKRFTEDFYHMDGICYPHAISGTGTVIASSHTLNGTMMNIQTAGETVKYAWDYYDFTGDREFLREIGYPLLKDIALFYSDYLQTDENGVKYIFPSRSQEFTNPAGLSNEFMKNSIIDLCLFRFILTKTAEAAEILGVDEKLAEKWRDDASHLRPDYATWPDGTWKTCEDCDDRTLDYGVPSVSDLTPVALTGEVDKWHGTPEMRAAAEKSVKTFVKDNALPWDLSFGILARLRFADKKYAGFVLDMLPDSREGGNISRADACHHDENNVLLPDGSDDFFVDKGAAYFTEVITEMLLQSQGGVIRVFPAYPEERGDAAFWSLRARGAFLVASEMRNKKVAYAIVRSLKGNDCVFANPFEANAHIRDLETLEEVPFEFDGDSFRFKTVPEHEYVIENINAPLESFPVIH